MDAAAESGRKPMSKHQPIRFSLSVKMSGLKQYRVVEPASRDQFLRGERGQGKKQFLLFS